MTCRCATFVLLCVALAVIGCGGDDNAASNRPREEFVAQGDDLCQRANEKFADINEGVEEAIGNATDVDQALADAAPILAEGYELQRDYVSQFRALTPPPGDEETVDKIVAGLEQQVSLLGQLADAADAADADRFQQLAPEMSDTRSHVRGLLQGYGFHECGNGAERRGMRTGDGHPV